MLPRSIKDELYNINQGKASQPNNNKNKTPKIDDKAMETL